MDRARRLSPVSLFLAACALLGCGLVGFDITRNIPEQTVPGSPLGAVLPASPLFEIPLEIDLQAETAAQGTGPATSARLKSLSLEVVDPADGTFDFLDSLSIAVEAEGRDKREVARLNPVPDEKQIQLQVLDVNLLPYIKSGMTLTASGTGRQPTREVTFKGRVVIRVEI